MEGPAARAKFIARIIGFHVLGQIIKLHVAASYHHLRVGVVLDVVRAEPRVLVADIDVAIRVEDSAGLLLLVCFEGGFTSCRGEPERSFRANLGEDPDRLAHTYAKLINDVIKGKPDDMAVTMHLCRGNFQSAWVAEGGYEPVAEVLFNEVGVDGFFLEYDDERSGGFEPLRLVPKGKTIVLGLVTTKQGALETKDSLKRRIDQAAKFIPLDQLALSPQCGFSSTVHGNKITVADEIAKLRLVVETAREVWG